MGVCVNDPETPRGRRELRPTMRDVAALAGVSVMTVSRVVNGDRRVSQARVERVRKAIEMLDYAQNVPARNLRLTGQPTASIGVVQEDIANPFASVLQRAVEDVVAREGCLVLCGSSDGAPERERALIAEFCARRVDGLVIVPAVSAGDHTYLLPEIRRGTPVVFVDRPSHSVAADTVVSDNVGGAQRAVEHLLAHGHTRIGFLGDLTGIYTGDERYRGYRNALRAAGLGVDEQLVRRDVHDVVAAREATQELLSLRESPTALFTAQNLLTIGSRQALHALGAERTIAHVGFDDIVLANLLDPAITVVAQDPAAIGSLAGELLIERINGASGPPETVEVPIELISRSSGEIAPRPSGPPTTQA
jgi:LacI family transcriptional regulator